VITSYSAKLQITFMSIAFGFAELAAAGDITRGGY
jgi:hypothetical protein